MLDAGITDSSGCGAGTLVDSEASFDTSVISPGDLVYQSDGTFWGKVTSIVSLTELTITGTAVNSTSYYILEPRMFFAWEDSGAVRGSLLRLEQGTVFQVGASDVFDIATAGTRQNVHVVHDSNDGVFIIYESDGSGTIYGKRLDATGNFIVGTNGSTTGENVGTGTILDVQPDNNGGVYILYDNGTNIQLTRRTGTLASSWDNAIVANTFDAAITVDTADNVIVAYTNGNYDIYAQNRNRTTGATTYTGMPVCQLSTAATDGSYGSGLSIISDDAGGAIISWLDTRFYPESGYVVATQAIDSSGGGLWNADASGTDYDGIILGPTSTFYPAEVGLWQLIYGDGGTPWGGLTMWYDYRSSNDDLYFDIHANP